MEGGALSIWLRKLKDVPNQGTGSVRLEVSTAFTFKVRARLGSKLGLNEYFQPFIFFIWESKITDAFLKSFARF